MLVILRITFIVWLCFRVKFIMVTTGRNKQWYRKVLKELLNIVVKLYADFEWIMLQMNLANDQYMDHCMLRERGWVTVLKITTQKHIYFLVYWSNFICTMHMLSIHPSFSNAWITTKILIRNNEKTRMLTPL